MLALNVIGSWVVSFFASHAFLLFALTSGVTIDAGL